VDAIDPHTSIHVKKIFYANDGCLGGNEHLQVQQVLELIIDLFSRVGLSLNPMKTVSMSNRKHFWAIHKDTRALLKEQLGETYEWRSTKMMGCPLCDRQLQVCSFVRHCRHMHPNDEELELSNRIYTPASTAPAGTNLQAFWHAADGTNCRMECPVAGCSVRPD